MKKILLIGELNKAIENLNESLMQDFQVQVCSMDLEDVKIMTKIVKPDMVILCLIGSYELDSIIFEWFERQRITIPVLTIGTEKECYIYSQFYEKEQFHVLFRPILKRALLEKCHSIVDPIGGKKAEQQGSKEKKKMKKSIMVVDDSPLVLRNIKSMLEPQYKVFVSSSGEQALKFIPEKKPDLILLDYEMPKMDGRLTFEKIKEMDGGREIPVVFLTGVADRGHIYAVLQLEPAGYILKPPAVDKLLGVIEEILGKDDNM
ncbi:MAG: response regulator [Lachnospiraceae bacterium]